VGVHVRSSRAFFCLFKGNTFSGSLQDLHLVSSSLQVNDETALTDPKTHVKAPRFDLRERTHCVFSSGQCYIL